MQVHNISMENLTWEERDEDKQKERENTMMLRKYYDDKTVLNRLSYILLANVSPLYAV